MTIVGAIALRFLQPWWLVTALLAVPAMYLAWRNLAALGRARQVLAALFRIATILLLAAILAQPVLTRRSEQMTLVAVLDRSQSVPSELQESALNFLDKALPHKQPQDQLAVVDVAEAAAISKLPTTDVSLRRRTLALDGSQSRLAAGIEMAMAIAPPGSANRLLLVSDGNETAGDLREAARVAAANGIPIDVLPLTYAHRNEVIFRNLVAPVRARSGQTIPLRMVLTSTGPAKGHLLLSVNGTRVDLDPTSPQEGVNVELQAGTNVKTVSWPVGTRGVHDFRATFIPDSPASDSLEPNNQASAITVVSGPGHVLVAEGRDGSAEPILTALQAAQIAAKRIAPADFPSNLVMLADCDAVVMVNIDSSSLTYQQQDMLCRYVSEMGGGLVMVGGPHGFGAGGWIGSSLAEILPVDCDPPQRKQMPKGALALIMHACEMERGNYWGKQTALAAVNALSRRDLVGVLDYGWNSSGAAHWVYPLSEVGDREAVKAAIDQMPMGDMPDFGTPMQAAYNSLKACDAGQKHVIIISDGDPQMPSPALLKSYADSGISCTGVAVNPHSQNEVQSLMAIAQKTGGRFYHIQDARTLPQIFIKEAQVVRRALLIEHEVKPEVRYGLSDIVRGLGFLPPLGGYVLTGPKGGLAQTVLTTPEGDPLLAQTQAGLGRCVAFTSSADSRWAQPWMTWGGFNRFWEQAVRWAARPAQSLDCELMADVQGKDVVLTVEAMESGGTFQQFAQISAQAIAPDMSVREVPLAQVGPGRYRGQFQADAGGGSYVVNLRYRKVGADASQPPGLMHFAVAVPYAPEYRDLVDNKALLAEVAAITGGRVISADPASAKLFDREGLKFPRWTQPLTVTMILIWLGVFLLDVAVRRLAIDFTAIGKWVVRTATWRKAEQKDATLDRLKARRQEYREQVAGRTTEAQPAAPARPPVVTEIPESLELLDETTQEKPAAPPAGPAEAAPPPLPKKPDGPASLQQLLKAKKQAHQRLTKPDEKPNDPTGRPTSG